jgi:hypothetical protein
MSDVVVTVSSGQSINVTIGKGLQGDPGLVQSVVAGTNVTVDNTDPANPVVSATGVLGAVDSVNGQTGAVVLDIDDVAPTQTGNSGKVLKTDGTNATWQADTGGSVDSVNGQSGTVSLDQDDIPDGTTYKQYSQTEKTKLAGIETAADVTDTANVTAAGALMDSEVTNLAAVKAFDPTDYATAAQGATADTAVQPGDLAAVATSGDYGDLSNTPDLSVYDEVEQYADLGSFPGTGNAAKFYLAQDTGIMYRWTGATYAVISAQLALGETSSTAYRGDRGKIAYDHSLLTSGNPHSVTKSDVGLGNADNTSDLNKPISTATQAALDDKQDVLSEGPFVDGDKTKLNGIEAGADVTDATNVDAAGATMNTDTTLAGNSYFLDEDTMSSNDATKVPSQQSVKAYVDNSVITDHGALSGLSDDDHTQYALLAGRSGGQTLIGGTASSNNLLLRSTSDSTKGYISIGETPSTKVIIGGTSMPLATSAVFGVNNNRTFSSAGDNYGNDFRSLPTFSGTTGGNFTGADFTTLPTASVNMNTITAVSFQSAGSSTGTVTQAIGVTAFATSVGAPTTTATSANVQVGGFAGVVTNGVGVSIVSGQFFGSTTNGTGMYVGNLPGSTSKTAIDVAAQTGATTNIGVRIDKASQYTLQLSSTAGDAASGITWGTDTQLYRSAANTLTLATGDSLQARVQPRASTTTSSATPTINTDNVDIYGLTAQTADITSFTTNLSGTPTNGQRLWIYVVGTAARAITWGSSFENGAVTLPTTTVTTQRLDVLFVWNSVTSKWRCMASGSA